MDHRRAPHGVVTRMRRSQRARVLAPILAILFALGAAAGPARAVVNAVFPSTNDANRSLGWAHVDQVSVTDAAMTLSLVNPREFASCFEIRSDGDTSQRVAPTHFNRAVTDGLYPFVCVNNETRLRTVAAAHYVEVRLAFGAEADERFDWTRFDLVLDPETKADCKDGGWAGYGFRNQGLCIAFVLTGRDTR
jgi:hypothetical protein